MSATTTSASSSWLTANVRYGRAAAAAGVVLSIAGLVTSLTVVLLEGSGFDLMVANFQLQLAAIGIGFGLLSWSVLPREPANRVVWVYATVALFAGLFMASDAVAFLGLSARGLAITSETVQSLSPADLSLPVAVAVMVGTLAISPAIFWLLSLGILMFPDGRLPSRRWRWVVWLAIVSGIATAVIIGYAERPGSTVTFGEVEGDAYDEVITPPLVALMIATFASFIALFLRFRRSRGVERQQIRWILFGTALVVPALAGAVLLSGTGNEFGVSVLVLLPLLIFMACFWVALTRYRLYDIDIFISRTFVYGALAAFIGVVYVLVVVVIGTGVGGGSDPNPALALPATALVAVAFHPLRRRLQKVANRIVYGKRATPYEVLSEFSRQVAATDESLLSPVARFLTEGTVATSAAIWAIDDGHMRQLSAWPEDGRSPEMLPAANPDRLLVEGADLVLPITESDEVLGVLTLATPPGQDLPAPDRELAEELSAGIGLALRNIRLTHDLEQRVAELRESRRRIVAVQDETRRTLERDLHDGAQQRLVALKVKLALAGQVATRDGATRTAEFLTDLSGQADDAITELRDFARGIYPPLLEAEGLSAALRSEASRLPIVVDVASEGIRRYPKALEATIYFCVLEALHNVVSHAEAGSAQVTLRDDGETLGFEVRDAGVGFDSEHVSPGRGMVTMTDRIDAAGGTLSIHSSVGTGTTVSCSIPLDGENA